jgi:prephenate dehydrogenase
MALETLTIIGVGLIGGSLGLAAKQHGAVRRVIGMGRDERTLERAAALGAIDEHTTSLAEAVRTADLVIVCTPVDRVAKDVLAVADAAPPRAVITDAGSTKGNIVQALTGKLTRQQAAFVGSHPLAGSEKKGAAHARGDLFENRLVIITPTPETDGEAIGTVELFWQKLGARVCRMDPFEHDVALAYTSHLPHAVAAALAGVTPSGWLGLTAGGFRDTTRIAGGDPELWQAIFQANREAVLKSVADFETRMANFRTALENNDSAALIHWLAEGKKVRDALGS